MKKHLAILAFIIVSFCFICDVCLSADEATASTTRSARSGRGGFYGDWQVTIDYDGRDMKTILSFSRDADGNRTGQWISFWGLSELQDVKYENGQLSFTQVRKNREGESFTSKFKGTIEDGKLSGIITSDRGEYKVKGERSSRMSRAVGCWEMKLKMGDREFVTKLVVKAGEERKLTAEWQSEWGEHEITDISYDRGKLTFKRKSKIQDRQWESTFNGAIGGDAISGVITSDRGEIKAEGKRIGAAVIGSWNLEVTSERGTRKQRLKVNPDMSGLYGAIAIDKVNLEDNKVSFIVAFQFGDREFEMTFEGKVDGATLTGELTTSRGTQKVTGTKVVRRSRTRRSTR